MAEEQGVVKTVFIMRGVPGSGKSTFAARLAGSGGVVHSTDNYFVKNWVYHFDPYRLKEFHQCNFEAFCRSLEAGVPTVVCDNTNFKRWHFAPYVEAAKRAGYRIVIVSVFGVTAEEAAKRSIHHVPVHVIQRMLDEWED